jgi:CheY-like chemotaxis protein
VTAEPATALVIDDESLVRRLVRRMLEPEVCRVLEAGDGEAGLRLIERTGDTIDVVLTDLLMAGIDGYDVVEVLATTGRTSPWHACRASRTTRPSAGNWSCRSSPSPSASKDCASCSHHCSRAPERSAGRRDCASARRISAGLPWVFAARPVTSARSRWTWSPWPTSSAGRAREPGRRVRFPPRERGGTGRRAGLRILSRKGSGFDSRRSHTTTTGLSSEGPVVLCCHYECH